MSDHRVRPLTLEAAAVVWAFDRSIALRQLPSPFEQPRTDRLTLEEVCYVQGFDIQTA